MDHPSPRVCLLPYRQRLPWIRPSQTALTDLQWPLGVPGGIGGQTLADLTPQDHLLTPPHDRLFLTPSFGTRARVSVFLMEPRAVHRQQMILLRLFHSRFHRILTADSKMLADIPNAVFFPVGGAWVPDGTGTDLTKRAMCSLIASEKAQLPGHRLRHDLVRWIRETGQDVDIMGRAYKPFAQKSEGLAPYRYSLIIENAQEKNYFTEKLIDAMLCNTVPIYWGCPNIADFFDTAGMILCRDLAEMQSALAQMSVADHDARQQVLAENRAVAAGYADIHARAARTILQAG